MSETTIPRYAVLFKIHFWDDFADRQFVSLRRCCPSGDVWIAVDETHGPVDGIEHDRVFRTRDRDMHALGLPRQDGVSLNWYNNDYPMLAFYQAHPHYDFYVMVEFDVAVRVALDALVDDAFRRGIDLVAHPLPEPVDQWHWAYTMDGVWRRDEIANQLLCVSAFSHRAVAHLMMLRLEHAARYEKGEFPHWPFAEGFVPTALKTTGFVLEELAHYGSVRNYDWWPPFHESQLPDLGVQGVVHPVLTGPRYVNSVLRFSRAETYLSSPPSRLRLQLDREQPGIVLPALVEASRVAGDVRALIALKQAADDLADPACKFLLAPILSTFVPFEAPENLARDKFAYQSSVCSWSRGPDPATDAARALNGEITGDAGFHSDEEYQPWWSVDLGEPCLISEMRLYNRLIGSKTVAARANYLSIWSSCNGRHWDLIHRHADTTPFGGVDGNPLVIPCEIKIAARFIRIECDGMAILHLDEVEVFGVRCRPADR